MPESIKVRVARLEERERAGRMALQLNAREMKRRLKALNGEAARIKLAADSSVSREKFDDYVRAQALSHANLSKIVNIGVGIILTVQFLIVLYFRSK